MRDAGYVKGYTLRRRRELTSKSSDLGSTDGSHLGPIL